MKPLIATKKYPLNCAIERVANIFMCQKSVFFEFLESFLRSEKVGKQLHAVLGIWTMDSDAREPTGLHKNHPLAFC